MRKILITEWLLWDLNLQPGDHKPAIITIKLNSQLWHPAGTSQISD